MTHRASRSIGALSAASVVLLAAAVAGCGGGGASAATVSPPKTSSGQAATVGVAHTGLGETLVDSQGRTLYLFKADQGTKSACTGACAGSWPPLLAKGKPTLGGGVNASLVGTATRPEGTTQVTYNGHPLYLFVKDAKAGETNGQGVTAFGAQWFALNSGGNQASGESASSTSGGGPSY
jgi:predicted lipoprotein with Yx(FWY)xxD motif